MQKCPSGITVFLLIIGIIALAAGLYWIFYDIP